MQGSVCIEVFKSNQLIQLSNAGLHQLFFQLFILFNLRYTTSVLVIY